MRVPEEKLRNQSSLPWLLYEIVVDVIGLGEANTVWGESLDKLIVQVGLRGEMENDRVKRSSGLLIV